MRLKKFLRITGITLAITSALLALFVVAFVFNPLEGGLRDMRDIVPREVDFFVRKTDLRDDFVELPEPVFWEEFTYSSTWQELSSGPLVQDLRRQGIEQSLQQIADGVRQVRSDSAGFLDPMRDLLGREVIVAGTLTDRSVPSRPQPLAEPWYCAYMRVSWRVRFIWGLLQWGIVQSQAASQGLQITEVDGLLKIEPRAGQPLFATRHLDCLMVGNNEHILRQSLALAQGSREEEPFGQKAAYTDGVVQRILDWEYVTEPEEVNALEFSVAPNEVDAFRRFALSWPSAANENDMNERVLAAFLNLTGWNSVSGALLFEYDKLSFLGEVVLNSHMHTPFQSQFFRTEEQQRSKWLDPFLRMVPINACAAAALRMPAGDFLHAMYDALGRDEKDLFNDTIRRTGQYSDVRDLIDKIKISLLPRTGFVFRKNVPDLSRDENGDLMIPVAAISPVPQIAWVFWLRGGGEAQLELFVNMLERYRRTFRFERVYNLDQMTGGAGAFGGSENRDSIKEFTNPQIPGTGEIATLLFRDFFVFSNSGPLIRDMFNTRYGNIPSVLERDDMTEFDGELPQSLNGFVYLNGEQMGRVFEDYRDYIQKLNQDPDPSWEMINRRTAVEQVLRTRFPQYRTEAGIPPNLKAEFDQAVRQELRTMWTRQSSDLQPEDLARIEQMLGICKMVEGAYVQVELENNYIRFMGKVRLDYR